MFNLKQQWERSEEITAPGEVFFWTANRRIVFMNRRNLTFSVDLFLYVGLDAPAAREQYVSSTSWRIQNRSSQFSVTAGCSLASFMPDRSCVLQSQLK